MRLRLFHGPALIGKLGRNRKTASEAAPPSAPPHVDWVGSCRRGDDAGVVAAHGTLAGASFVAVASGPRGKTGSGVGSGKLAGIVVAMYRCWQDGAATSRSCGIRRAQSTIRGVSFGLSASSRSCSRSHHGLVADKSGPSYLWRSHIDMAALGHARVILDISDRSTVVHISNLGVAIRPPLLLHRLRPLLLILHRTCADRKCSRSRGTWWKTSLIAGVAVM